MKTITFKALKITQPVGDFFIGAIPFNDLVQISFSDIRRIEGEREIESYLGIQRGLNPKRVQDLRAYVQHWDATFPTSVILAVDSNSADWNEATGKLTLTEVLSEDGKSIVVPFDKIAKILDGQHRVAGLQTYTGSTFDIPVAIFVGADIAQQASIFSIVNLAQTKVNKSLVYDLFDLANSRSPQKTCHNVAVGLDRNEKSPFYARIKRLGVATPVRINETLTQATFVESLIYYLSEKPNDDRDVLLRRKKLVKATTAELQKVIFRNLFIEDKDENITKIVWSYFAAVEYRWQSTWNDFSKGNILTKTNGFRALMRFLRPAYLSATKEIGDIPASQSFLKILEKVKLEKDDFNIVNFPPGTSGESNLHKKLLEDTGLS